MICDQYTSPSTTSGALIGRLLFLAFLFICPHYLCHANGNNPDPVKYIKYKNADIALYDGKILRPQKDHPPQYPDEARANALEGRVYLIAIINNQGNVEAVAVESCDGDASFATSAKACVFKWQYKPMLRDGRPVQFAVRIPIYFAIGT